MNTPADPSVALKSACDRAYVANKASCSNAVWDVIKDLVNPEEPFRNANAMVDYMSISWKGVSLDDGFDLANAGTVVVGGLKNPKGHGHVIVIYPGPKKPAGGYSYWYKKSQKYILLPPKGLYPRAMSTSIAATSSLAWPGTLSCGDKTVWDPWGDDDTFDDVKFWTPKAKAWHDDGELRRRRDRHGDTGCHGRKRRGDRRQTPQTPAPRVRRRRSKSV
jgi:hypothetical protein